MAIEETETEGQIQEPADGQETTENPTEEVDAGSSPAIVEDSQAKLREYEAKLARQEERNRYLEQTNQLLERFSQQPRQQAPSEPGLSPELLELDRTLDPLFSKRINSKFEPLNSNLAALMDGQDYLRFENYLMRHHRELLDDEESMNRVNQQVEQIRRQAQQVYGKELSRIDAFLYAQGMEGVKEKQKSRQTKKVTQVREEATRQLQNQAARSGEGRPEVKRSLGGEIPAIREKLKKGERLTPAEKDKFRKYLDNASRSSR